MQALPSSSSARRLVAAIVDAAHRASSVESWQREVFAIVAPVGFDVAFLETKAPSQRLFAHGLDARVLASVRPRWSVFERELAPVTRASVRDGVAVDTDVLGPSRERYAYYQELVRPHRGAHSLLAHLGVGGRAVGGLMLVRTGAPFREPDRALVRALLAPLAVGLAAVHAGAAVAPWADPAVTPREREGGPRPRAPRVPEPARSRARSGRLRTPCATRSPRCSRSSARRRAREFLVALTSGPDQAAIVRPYHRAPRSPGVRLQSV